jgi:hypothetical protein
MKRCFGLALLMLLPLLSGCGQSASVPPIRPLVFGQYIYAAQDDGTIRVYDINQHHLEVLVIAAFPCCSDVRGITAAAPTHRLYVMYNTRNAGHLLALDLLSGRVIWDIVEHVPGVDRGQVTPDGRTIYLPTWESDPNTPYELVIDARNGAIVGKIILPPRSHDTVVNLAGTYVYMETKSPTGTIYIASTTSNQVVRTITGYCCGGVLQPFSINAANSLMVNDVVNYDGFQVASVTTGKVIESVPFPGPAGSAYGHGIAWTPNEHEVWAVDGGVPAVHVFNMTVSPPVQTHLIRVGARSNWVTINLDGRYAYISGPKGSTDPTYIVDAHTYQIVGTLPDSYSEDLLEVDFSGSQVSMVGNQFGLGRA